jgi:hypothetical protein
MTITVHYYYNNMFIIYQTVTLERQTSTLTIFLTCPFGQLTKKKYLSDSIF